MKNSCSCSCPWAVLNVNKLITAQGFSIIITENTAVYSTQLVVGWRVQTWTPLNWRKVIDSNMFLCPELLCKHRRLQSLSLCWVTSHYTKLPVTFNNLLYAAAPCLRDKYDFTVPGLSYLRLAIHSSMSLLSKTLNFCLCKSVVLYDWQSIQWQSRDDLCCWFRMRIR